LGNYPCFPTPTPTVTPTITPSPLPCSDTSFISTLSDCYEDFCISNLEGPLSVYNGTDRKSVV
jgi:hypothetical protein